MNREEYREEYLRSEHWRETRLGALERAGHRCQVCNSPRQLDVHHRTYDRLGKEEPSDLTVLCRRCHDIFHNSRGKQPKPSTPRKKPKKRRAGKHPVKVSCAFCKGKGGHHEHHCKRSLANTHWNTGVASWREREAESKAEFERKRQEAAGSGRDWREERELPRRAA